VSPVLAKTVTTEGETMSNEAKRLFAAARREGARLADDVWKLAVKWEGFARESLGIPLVAALDRVGTALATVDSPADTAAMAAALRLAAAHLRESEYLLWRVHERGLVSSAGFERLGARLRRLAATVADCLARLESGRGETPALSAGSARASESAGSAR